MQKSEYWIGSNNNYFLFSQSFILSLHLLKGSSNTGQFYYLCYDIVFLRL